ncbi:MAG: peptide deformylase [Candidatus Lambdaproteobacteria bacterium]|nr:peptide deformylase [Candidatus Lambdaproteobacteria bacterium]
MTDSQHEDASLPPLVTLGNPRLAQPSRAVAPGRIAMPEFQARLEVLHLALVEYEGIGIAAPQIGWFERVFLMGEPRTKPGEGTDDGYDIRVWINPEIVSASAELCWAWEGCLSVPGLRGWIRRPAAVAVRGLDSHGRPLSRELAGWPARVFQHEFDHLEGLLFPYRALDPRHVVTLQELAAREGWPEGWPAPGARSAPLGQVVPEQG